MGTATVRLPKPADSDATQLAAAQRFRCEEPGNAGEGRGDSDATRTRRRAGDLRREHLAELPARTTTRKERIVNQNIPIIGVESSPPTLGALNPPGLDFRPRAAPVVSLAVTIWNCPPAAPSSVASSNEIYLLSTTPLDHTGKAGDTRRLVRP